MPPTAFIPATDINECLENPSICGGNECENSCGTYTCVEPSTISPTPSTTTIIEPTTTTEMPREVERGDDDNTSDAVEGTEITEKNEGEEEEEEDEEKLPPENEIESEKFGQYENVVENSHETRHSTPEPSSSISTAEPSTIMENEISGQVESDNESGEGSNDDGRPETELHHQSSTVRPDVGRGSECDDGLDGDGKCVGE